MFVHVDSIYIVQLSAMTPLAECGSATICIQACAFCTHPSAVMYIHGSSAGRWYVPLSSQRTPRVSEPPLPPSHFRPGSMIYLSPPREGGCFFSHKQNPLPGGGDFRRDSYIGIFTLTARSFSGRGWRAKARRTFPTARCCCPREIQISEEQQGY